MTTPIRNTPLQTLTDYYVFTDGACSGNGRSTAKAGIGVFFGEDDPRNISRRVEGKQTNNTAELTAMIEAIKSVIHDITVGQKHVTICTDSVYVMRSATTFGKKCAQKQWQDDIPNKQLVQQLYHLYDTYQDHIRLLHVMAHTGQTDALSIGNEHADRLANLAIGVNVRKGTGSVADHKIYLAVPYEEKDEAKKLGAKWDPKRKKWFVLETGTGEHTRELCEKYSMDTATI